MPVKYIKSARKTIKEDAKKHRPIDWFAIVVLISVALVTFAFVGNKIDEFNNYMEAVIKGIMDGIF